MVVCVQDEELRIQKNGEDRSEPTLIEAMMNEFLTYGNTEE